MRRKAIISPGEYYHIYNRGVEKRKIFLDKKDYIRFQKLLYLSQNQKAVVYKETKNKKLGEIPINNKSVYIGSYCLMPNHFHILIKEKEGGGISNFMRKLLTAYSMYFNKKYNRKGPLFESRFYSQHIDSDNYLKYIYSYICLNPTKLIDPEWKDRGIKDPNKALKYCSDYEYSSTRDHLGIKRDENLILDLKEFPEYFVNTKDFKSELLDWLKYAELE